MSGQKNHPRFQPPQPGAAPAAPVQFAPPAAQVPVSPEAEIGDSFINAEEQDLGQPNGGMSMESLEKGITEALQKPVAQNTAQSIKGLGGKMTAVESKEKPGYKPGQEVDVITIRPGYYKNIRREKDDKFTVVVPPNGRLGTWMREI